MMVSESSNNDVCLFKSWDKLGLFDGYDDDEFNQWCKFHSYNDMAQLDYVKYWTDNLSYERVENLNACVVSMTPASKKYDMDHRFMRVGSVSFLNENEEFEVETVLAINPCARLCGIDESKIYFMLLTRLLKCRCRRPIIYKLHVSFSSIDDQFPAFKSIYGYDTDMI
ncbi:unnamed protein product [Rhizophagus irregularis]|nr:unnamed protein product [Rhizophagus irregularis]